MGSLANQYISQSYQSLIHLGSDSTISSSYTDLQDGLGNTLNISVNAQGDISASGNIYAANLASITYDTGSLLVTASANLNNITFTKGNGSTFNVNVNTGSLPAGTVSGSSQVVLEDTTYTDNGNKSFLQTDGAGNLSFQYVDTIWESFYAGESVAKGTPLYLSGSVGANPIARAADASNPNKMPVTLIAGDNLTAGNVYEGIVLGLIEGLNLTGYTEGQTVYVAEGGGWSTSLPSGSNSITQVLGIVTKGGNGGKGLVLNPGPAQLPTLQTGYTWVGNGSNRAVAVSTGSFGTTVNTGSLMVTGSVNVNVLTFTKGDGSTFDLVVSASGSVTPGTISGSAQISALGFVTSAITASSLITASFSGNTLTFTKGDSTTFGVLIPDISGSTIDTGSLVTSASFNAYTSSTNQRLDSIEAQSGSWVTAAITASSLVTASFSGNTLTFTKGDSTTFGVVIPDVSGSTINTGSFATTGSNNFVGTENINGQLNVTGSSSFTGSMTFLSGSASGSVVTNVGDTFTGTAAVTKIITLSSAEYSALTPKDPNTLYIIA